MADLSNPLLNKSLSFKEFVEKALYSPESGYYIRARAGADYATSPRISPVFGFALARVASEFMSRLGDEMCSVVDIGCGDGTLLKQLISELPAGLAKRCRFFGVDRAAKPGSDVRGITFADSLNGIDGEAPMLVISNELFDALPFARLVQRPTGLYELHVTEGEGNLEWGEAPAGPEYVQYFRERGITLQDGQFADVSLGWDALCREICALAPTAMILTFDYGYEEQQLFDNRARRFGTAAAYSNHGVHRDLLARPSEQDLTAHINFSDLLRAGQSSGFTTLSFLRQAEFLLRVGVTEHPLLMVANDVTVNSLNQAVELMEERESARGLVLPDGIGEDIKVLVQGRGVPLRGWSFQRPLF